MGCDELNYFELWRLEILGKWQEGFFQWGRSKGVGKGENGRKDFFNGEEVRGSERGRMALEVRHSGKMAGRIFQWGRSKGVGKGENGFGGQTFGENGREDFVNGVEVRGSEKGRMALEVRHSGEMAGRIFSMGKK